MKSDNAELKTLRKENHELKEQIRVLQELLDVLKDMPGVPTAPKAPVGKKIKQSKTHPNFLSQDRSLAPGAKAKEG
jgi:hypothetical protein